MTLSRIGLAILPLTALLPGQAATWTQLDGPTGTGRGFVFDTWRSRGVMLGQDGGTWEWNGTDWLHRPMSTLLFPRSRQAMAFDSVRGHTLMFGGLLPGGGGLADTWTWDGCEWRQPFSILTPPRRVGAAMTFDATRSRAVMFGGQDPVNATLLDDTWEHDGNQWTRSNPPLPLPDRTANAGMAFDSHRGVSVLLMNASGNARVWEWNGAVWTQRQTGGPAIGNAVTIAFSDSRRRTVLFGAGPSLNEVWEWDGNAWAFRGTSPQSRSGHGTAYDPRTGNVLIAGGMDGLLTAQPTSVLAWNGTATSVLANNRMPPPRNGAAMAHDSVRGRTVMFGGSGFGAFDDHWEWDGLRWTQLLPSPRPSARHGCAACFDPIRGQMLLFGGLSGSAFVLDSWRWNGSSWTTVPTGGPNARNQARMVWDSARGRVVMFGGDNPQGTLSDTWAWNGSQWTRLQPLAPPHARWAHAMAYDQGRDRIVLHGGLARGSSGVTTLVDTWLFDGQQWLSAFAPTVPPPLTGIAMAYDGPRGRCVLGGVPTAPTGQVQTWEYDGLDWTQTVTFLASAGVVAVTMVTDARRQRILLHDGERLREACSPAAAVVPFGQGCGTPAPRLAARTSPRTGDANFGLDAQARAALPVVFALGLGQGSTALGHGCTLLVQQPQATALVIADARGFAPQTIPLPANHSLRGLVMTAQAGVLDPTAIGGFTVSAGLRITVGD